MELASGSTTLYRTPAISTLLSREDVEPLIPLRALVEQGFQIRWNSSVIRSSSGRRLECELRQGCPVMKRHDGLLLLEQLEEQERAQQKRCVDHGWWTERFPRVPEEVFRFMQRQSEEDADMSRCPWNRRVRRRLERSAGIFVHLFAGASSSEWKSLRLKGGYEVLTVELQDGQNLHDEATWSYLVSLAQKGLVCGVVGGP